MDACPLDISEGGPGSVVEHPEYFVDLDNCFVYEIRCCRAFNEYVGLISKDPLQVTVFAVAVLVLLLFGLCDPKNVDAWGYTGTMPAF